MYQMSETEFLEQSRQKQINELEEALKNPQNGSPECRMIAKQGLKILKNNKLLQLHNVSGREL